MLLAYLLNNNDMAAFAESRIKPEDFVTSFNSNLYSYILSKVKEGIHPMTTVTLDFTGQEVSKFYAILASYNSQAATRQAMDEYIDTILEEKNRLTPSKIEAMTPEEILASIKMKKKNN